MLTETARFTLEPINPPVVLAAHEYAELIACRAALLAAERWLNEHPLGHIELLPGGEIEPMPGFVAHRSSVCVETGATIEASTGFGTSLAVALAAAIREEE